MCILRNILFKKCIRLYKYIIQIKSNLFTYNMVILHHDLFNTCGIINLEMPYYNQLSANPSKTKYILFSRRDTASEHDLDLLIDDEKLERVHCTKFLGLFIDEHFIWDHHIEHCKKKVSRGVYAINMPKHLLSQIHLKTLYYSLIHPYLLYGIRLWGDTYQKHVKKLERVQKRAVRAIMGAKYNDPSTPLFKTLNM